VTERAQRRKRPRVVAIIAAYNEEDVIGQVVRDLIEQGVEVYLIDHCSSDGTVDEVKPFLGHGLIAIERFEAAGFALEAQLRRKEELAQEIDADWFINCDADELRESPWAERDLRAAIGTVDQLGYNAIEFELFSFPPTRDGFQKGDPLREFFRYWEPAASYDRIQIKGWKKSDTVDLSTTGGHEARVPFRRVFPIRFLLRHYPIRSQAHGERKVFAERGPRFDPGERRRGWHVQYDRLKQGDSFLRDPRELRRFDAEMVRLQLWLEHAGVSELRGELAAAREHELAEVQALRQLLDERGRRMGEIEAELRQVRAQLDSTYAQVEELRGSRTWRWTSPVRLAWRLIGKQ
jgi:glycosyltransferase involved in cell wall biosynthesis